MPFKIKQLNVVNNVSRNWLNWLTPGLFKNNSYSFFNWTRCYQSTTAYLHRSG